MIFSILEVLILVAFITLFTIGCIKNDEEIFYGAFITVLVGIPISIIVIIIGSIYFNYLSNFPTTTEKENVKLMLKDTPDLRAEIEDKVREYYGISLKKEKKEEK